MNQNKIRSLKEFYEQSLFDHCLPYWLKYSPDKDNKGYFTCFDRKWELYDTDKSVWFQGRGMWLFSKLFNGVEKRQEWLDTARIGYDFLMAHCFDTDGRMFFQVTCDGKPLRKRRYMYSEAFAVMGLAEYSKASHDSKALKKAVDTFEMMIDIYEGRIKTEPKVIPETRQTKPLAVPMTLLATIQSLRESTGQTAYDIFANDLVKTILEDFYKPDEKALFETVGLKGERLDSPQGRCINPGHSIETVWFLIHEGLYRQNDMIIRQALEILDYSLNLGWDQKYGGLFYFIDIENKPPEQLEWDMKLWWPHTEALYALLLAFYLTGQKKYEEWLNKVLDWSFCHFEDKVYGEWFGYLHRDGSVSNDLKGSLWKGPFHLPRSLLLNIKLLEKMDTRAKDN